MTEVYSIPFKIWEQEQEEARVKAQEKTDNEAYAKKKGTNPVDFLAIGDLMRLGL